MGVLLAGAVDGCQRVFELAVAEVVEPPVASGDHDWVEREAVGEIVGHDDGGEYDFAFGIDAIFLDVEVNVDSDFGSSLVDGDLMS